ncbi:MAG: small multi-drug export protein [Cyclobacteriaceae bacterium]|nr:small multi-drug export protein [Cyclobacteriaceae bacterium HetDA_MAG_MS6]
MPLLYKYFIVYISAAVRFFLGPSLGIAYGLGVITTTILTVLGMMTTVYLFSFFGDQIRSLNARLFKRKKKKLFTKKNRRFVKIWKKYGLRGVAFFTPIVLSPVIGAFAANVLDSNRKEIIKWMWFSAIWWASIESILLEYAKDLVVDFIP